ncbi:divergent polysaccharide deacetylase family protein [Candidatus Omnitrophota bacterium]
MPKKSYRRTKKTKRKGRAKTPSARRPRRKRTAPVADKTLRIILNVFFIVLLFHIVYRSGVLGKFNSDTSSVEKKATIRLASATKETISSLKKSQQVKNGIAHQQTVEEKKSQKEINATSNKEAPPLPYAGFVPIVGGKELDTDRPKIIFIVDDIGNTIEHQDELEALDDNVTYAILPLLPFSKHFSKLSESTNAEVIVHLPLEAADGRYPGPGMIETQMNDEKIKSLLSQDLKTVPQAVGVNSHMGSLGTTNLRLMTIILKELKRKKLFFLDSITTKESVAFELGKKIKLPVVRRDVFIDNVSSRPHILRQIQSLTEIAKHKGYAIGICHYRKLTLQILREEIPSIKRNGFEIISLSELIELL